MENTVNWPETIYSFTKPGKAIVTWKFVEVYKDGRGNYFSNYNQHNYISQMELDNYYYTDERDCRIALIDQLNQWKYTQEKQFEKKFGITTYDYQNQKLNEMDKSE